MKAKDLSIVADLFESEFGFQIPSDLLRLFEQNVEYANRPHQYNFEHIDFVLSIQYVLSPYDLGNYDVMNERISFAVNTDGRKLLVDVSASSLEVMQEEHDVDYIGVSVQDLLRARVSAPTD